VDRVRGVPGAWRDREVSVGDHVAVSPGAVPRFLVRFAEAYRPDRYRACVGSSPFLRRIIA
jgi:hypothetical protein